MISINGLSFSYFEEKNKTRISVLDNLSLLLEEKSVAVILGPSGCGKTTLLNLIAGLISPSEGSINWTTNLSEKKIAYVFQSPALIPWLNVRKNALFGAMIRNKNKVDEKIEEKCDQYLENYGLKPFELYYPRKLSGGMQQRLSLIRAVLSDAKLFLLDEPFNGTDLVMRKTLQNNLSEIVAKEDATVILVTHDIEEAVRLGDKIILLTPRPTKVKEIIDIDIPRVERLTTFFEENKLVEYKIRINSIFNSFADQELSNALINEA